MVHHRSRLATELELRLRDGLPALQFAADEIGARSVSVFLIKDGRTIRNLYMSPEAGNLHTETSLDEALGEALRELAGYAPESSSIARFLEASFQPGGTSFLLFSYGERRLHATVAFGICASATPARFVSSDIPVTARLAAIAVWSVYEVIRLHSELVVVNERLGKRKLIERAKGMLQVEHGLDEQQAYEHLRKLSRQRRIKMSEIAKDLLGGSQFP